MINYYACHQCELGFFTALRLSQVRRLAVQFFVRVLQRQKEQSNNRKKHLYLSPIKGSFCDSRIGESLFTSGATITMVLFVFLNNYIALETFIITEHHFITLSFSFVATYYPFNVPIPIMPQCYFHCQRLNSV